MSESSSLPASPQPTGQARFGGRKQWTAVGCAVGVVVLAAFLGMSFSMIKRGMYGLVERACDRVVRGLPPELSDQDRKQVLESMERLVVELRRRRDPDPLVGGFLSRVAAALDDDGLSVSEVRGITDFLQAELPPQPPSSASDSGSGKGGRGAGVSPESRQSGGER